MTTTLYLLTLMLPLATILIVFGMRYRSATNQARAMAASGDAYQDLAQKAVTAQGQIALSLSTVQSDLAQVAVRLASVEKMLKEVG